MPHRPVVIVETPHDWVVVPVAHFTKATVTAAVETALGLRPGVVRVLAESLGSTLVEYDAGRPFPTRLSVKHGRLAAPAPAAGTPAGG